MMFLPEKLASDQDKDEFATTARLICIAHNAAACHGAGSVDENRPA